jgi:hypothetical protein
LALILIGGLIYVIYHQYSLGLPNSSRRAMTQLTIDPARISELPFEVEPHLSDPFALAQTHLHAGRYYEATVYLYSYMLLALDHAHIIRLQKGKTNRMYLREISSDPELSAIVLKTMLAFEDVYFGRHSIDRQRLDGLLALLPKFHARLAEKDVLKSSKAALV